jgi:hypothetical protein
VRALQPQLPRPGRAAAAAEPGPGTRCELRQGGHRRPVRPAAHQPRHQAAQLTALSAATTLVTLGTGGNDIGWAVVLTRCVELDLIPALIPGDAAQDATPCQAYYTSGGADQAQQEIQAAAAGLAGALTDIKTRAPHARIYVVGYLRRCPPRAIPARTYSASPRAT